MADGLMVGNIHYLLEWQATYIVCDIKFTGKDKYIAKFRAP